jgi:hypothetical protein
VGPVGFVLTACIPDVTLDVASCGRERRWQMDAENADRDTSAVRLWGGASVYQLSDEILQPTN